MKFEINDEVCEGVNSLINQYASIKDGDEVMLCYTSDCKVPAAAIATALKIKKIGVRFLEMIPLTDYTFEEKFNHLIPEPESIIGDFIVISLEKDTMSHNEVIRSSLQRYGNDKSRAIRIISCCQELFSTALNADPTELSKLNTALLESMMSNKKLRIITKGGTNLDIELDNEKYRWISNRGVATSGNFMMLPAGEVATYPKHIEGTLVADFALNVNAITSMDVRLTNNPVLIQIKNGMVEEYSCENDIIKKLLDECFKTEQGRRVGELGFGTNPTISEPIKMNSHINERAPGVHIGFGDHNQLVTVAGYQCNVHLDLICRGGEIYIDEIDKKIDLSRLTPSINEHPKALHSEDLKSPELNDLEPDDCCGVFTDKGLQLLCMSMEE
jgi:hypothetical protein